MIEQGPHICWTRALSLSYNCSPLKKQNKTILRQGLGKLPRSASNLCSSWFSLLNSWDYRFLPPPGSKLFLIRGRVGPRTEKCMLKSYRLLGPEHQQNVEVLSRWLGTKLKTLGPVLSRILFLVRFTESKTWRAKRKVCLLYGSSLLRELLLSKELELPHL